MPGANALYIMTYLAASGARPKRWFSPIDPDDSTLHARYRWSARVTHWASTLLAAPLPDVEHAPLANPAPVLDWLRDTLRRGSIPMLYTPPSAAVRLCEAAERRRQSLRGVRFTLGAEPATPGRVAVINQSGAEFATIYSSMEAGTMAYGCRRPTAADDQHLFSDLVAVVQPGAAAAGTGLPARALLVTSLRDTASQVLLNVSQGDQADLTSVDCGCPLFDLGWHTRMRSIRSFEKLTIGGMAFLDGDVIDVLETRLPLRFGGGPNDYQLVEIEEASGRARLWIVIDPSVGALDDRAVVEALLEALSATSDAYQVMAMEWRDAESITVQRRPPLASATGKILHLHQQTPDQ